MSDNYEQPVEPMSRAEDILRGDSTVHPMSRVEALLKELIEAGGGGGGSTVVVTPIQQSGTKIANITVNGVGYDIFAPEGSSGSVVTIDPEYQSGTLLATLTIDGTAYYIYAPSSGGNRTYSGTNVPTSDIGSNGDLYIKYNIDTSHYDDILLNVNIPPVDANSWLVTEGALSGVKTIYGTGSWVYGQLTKVIDVENIPQYVGGGSNNFLTGNDNSYSGIAKDGDDLYLYVKGGITISGVYSRVYTNIPTNIDKIYAKIEGVWITTT